MSTGQSNLPFFRGDEFCDELCRTTGEGVKYIDFPDRFAGLRNLYLSIESEVHEYVTYPMSLVATNGWPYIPVIICVAYMVIIFGLQRYMKTRERFDLRYPLAWWNLLLSTFSFIGMIRTVPHLLFMLGYYPFRDTICGNPTVMYGNGASGLWVMLFIFSKVPELVDTLFIVLRKRDLIFLHWYHHVTVLLYCWHSYAIRASTGLYFISMNYTVHAVMYLYYSLMAFKMKPKWFPPGIITAMQISQMVVGCFICSVATYYYLGYGEVTATATATSAGGTDKLTGESGTVSGGGRGSSGGGCAVTLDNVVSGGLMYTSYLILFLQFAVKRFFTTASASKPKGKGNDSGSGSSGASNGAVAGAVAGKGVDSGEGEVVAGNGKAVANGKGGRKGGKKND